MTISSETKELIDSVLPEEPSMLPGDEPAPLWLSRGVHFFRVGLALFLALSCLLGLSGCTASSATPWQSATQFFSREQVAALLAENSTLTAASPEQVDRVKVLPLQQNVVAVNFNLQELCGVSDCLYSVYSQSNKSDPPRRLFSAYLNPGVPPGTPLFRQTDQTLNNYPCFQLNQAGTSTLKQSTLCFQERQYEVVSQVDVVVKDKK